jgi:hypothetical protein
MLAGKVPNKQLAGHLGLQSGGEVANFHGCNPIAQVKAGQSDRHASPCKADNPITAGFNARGACNTSCHGFHEK